MGSNPDVGFFFLNLVPPWSGTPFFFLLFYLQHISTFPRTRSDGYLYTDVFWDSLGSCVHSPPGVCRENAEWEAPFLRTTTIVSWVKIVKGLPTLVYKMMRFHEACSWPPTVIAYI